MKTIDLLTALDKTLVPKFEEYATNKTKVRVTFLSGKSKWGWVHQHEGRWWITRGNRVGFSLDTAITIKPMERESK